ncbi:MAG TPA: cysteine peptidase family C39 domain-containing protein [Chitinophagaceae bacterium]|nr:cysteine peptidase family C39 domain-containing protein [Chitinophagaceae bacterium]
MLQSSFNDCGPTCLKMIAAYYGLDYSINFLKKSCQIKTNGVSMLNIHKTAKTIGLYSKGVKLDIEKLKEIVQSSPLLLHCNQNHFVIVYKTPKPGLKGQYHVADPAKGLIKMREQELLCYWVPKPSADSKQSSNSHKKSTQKALGNALIIHRLGLLE